MDITPFLSAIISGVLAGGVAWGGMRAEVKGMRRDLERLFTGNEKAHTRIDDVSTRTARLEARRRG